MASGYNSLSGEESEELFEGLSSPEIDTRGTVANQSPNASAIRGSTVSRRLFSGTEPLDEDPLADVTNQSASRSSPRATAGNDTQLLILQEVKQANSRLDTFSDRLEALENRLTSVETHQLSSVTPSSSSTDSSADRGKRKVPAKVRVSRFCREPCISFMWLFLHRIRFTDSENQQIVKRLIAEVNTLDSKIPLIQVRGNCFIIIIVSEIVYQTFATFCFMQIHPGGFFNPNMRKRLLNTKESMTIKSNSNAVETG